MQCLFATETFRRGLLACPAAARSLPVLGQLRRVFALLQAGRRSVVDPTDFAKELELETGVQQDGQEFMKLLLQFVDRALSQASGPADADARRLVQRHFRGLCSFRTVCETCGRASDSSRKLVDFYELARRPDSSSDPHPNLWLLPHRLHLPSALIDNASASRRRVLMAPPKPRRS